MQTSRFNKMVILQIERAKALGYDEDIAKTIGYAKALQGAIFKRGTWRSGKKSKSRTITEKNDSLFKDFDNPDIWKKLPEFNIYKDIADRIKLSLKGKTLITLKDYEKWRNRIDDRLYERLIEWAKHIVENVNEHDLKVDSRFYNYVWKLHRDDRV